MKDRSAPVFLGYLAVAASAFFTNVWTFWGIQENFHEGWYSQHLLENVLMMFGQYLLIPLAFIGLAVLSVYRPRAGAIGHFLTATFIYLYFGKMQVAFVFIFIPMLGMAVLYWFSFIKWQIWALILVCWLPLLQILLIASFHLIRISGRHHGDHREVSLIEGNGVALVWAPPGLGWPDSGISWEEANRVCAHLNSDGKTLSDSVLNLWRLPDIQEAVASQVYHGKNAGGEWDPAKKKAKYKNRPDKEFPLWDPYRKTIYWWTSTEINSKQAYIIVYNGSVWPRNKAIRVAYLNFRAVRDPL